MKQFIKDYFTFNRAEKNGILVLVLLIVAVVSATFIISRVGLTANSTNPEIESEINQLTNSFEGTNIPWDAASTQPAEKLSIDLNLADTILLTQLTGIGPSLASRIVKYRDSVGRIDSINQLLNVKGIGEKKLDGFRNEVFIKTVDLVDEN